MSLPTPKPKIRLGYPAITTPRDKEVSRDVQVAVDNIRERLHGIEDFLQNLSNTTEASTTALTKQIAAASSTTSTQGLQTYRGSVGPGLAVYVSAAGTVSISDPTNAGQAFACIGVSQGPAPGGGVLVATNGDVISVPVGAFTPFVPVFAGPGGILTQSPPVPPAAAAIIQVGVALGSGSMLVAPAATLIDQPFLTGTAVDPFLPSGSTTWEVNGIQVGTRRNVDFVAGSGIVILGADDPTNNRVVIIIGLGSSGGGGCYPGH